MNSVAAVTETDYLFNARFHERLKKRYNRAKGIADLWLNILEASYHYAIPFRNRFYLPNKDFQGTMQNARLFDTTAVEGVKTFVSKIHEAMTPPGVQWGFLEVDVEAMKGPFDIDFIKNSQLTLNHYMRQLFKYIHKSNFDVIVNECYFDLAVGTSSIVVNQGTDKNPLMFTSIPIDKLSIEEAVNGKIESWYRTWEDLKIVELSTRWKNVVLSSSMYQDMNADPDATVRKIYEGVAYFADMPKTPYCYAVWTDECPILVEWLESNPGIVWRFQKTNNETWGRGPVMDALPTIISANEMARIEMAAANFETFRPFMGFSDGIFNPHTFKLEPFSVIPISQISTGGMPPLVPLPGASNPQFTQLTLTDYRMQINRLLYAETPSDSASVQPKTAYELAIKQQSLAQKIGPLFSRLQQECSERIIERVQHILHSTGILPKPEIEGIPIKFRYKSPLQLIQGQQDIARFTQWVQLMQGSMGPEVTQIYINPKTTPYKLAELLQVDPEFLNDADKVAEVMQNIQNQQSALNMMGGGSAESLPA